MIEGIGELTAQNVTRVEQQALVAGHENANREMSRVAVRRPVEAASGSQKRDAGSQNEAKPNGKYNLEHKFPVYEKYDQDGELIMQLPPVHNGKA